MPTIARESAISFGNQFRCARLAALGDAEAFDGIIYVIERLGSYLSKERLGDGEHGSLYRYTKELTDLASNSGMAEETPSRFSSILTPFAVLYELVTIARNDALHQGAFARHLTSHAIELSIILEDALSNHIDDPVVRDFMIRNPICAEPWQPIGFVRQQMLANSYSYLPMLGDDEDWYVISDTAIATFLGPERNGPARRKRLASTVREASDCLMPAKLIDETARLAEALKRLNDPADTSRQSVAAVLLVRNPAYPKRLLGILTAFDLL